ncbi:MAG: D-alanyl-D-alanine carboxypeptidase family protein [Faecalibacterium sp.]
MKRIFALFLSLVLLLGCCVLPAGAVGFDPSPVYEVQASSAYVVNTDTNIIVYEKDSKKQVPAGGLTKYMTIALVLTNYGDQLDATFTMPFAISDYVHGTDNADMRSGETFTLREAIYAMVMRNANDAAMGMAYTLSGGDLTGWVSQMNSLSQRIGTTGSTWTDACGLDDGNVTTAVDMYLILRYLMSFDAFVQISGEPTFTMPAKEKHSKSFVLISQNVALNKTSGGKFYRGAMQGGICDVLAYKNDNGSQSYVSWANKNGETYIFCVMESPDTCDDYGYSNRRPALYETTKLIDWVFDSFSIQSALDTDLALAEIPVKYSADTDTLMLYPDDNMMTILPSSGNSTVTQKYFHLPEYVCAPIQQGDVVGTVELKLAGETIGVVNLIAGQDVSRSTLLYTVAKIQDFFGSLYLKVVLVLSALAAGIYGLWLLLNTWHGRKTPKKIRRY